MSDLLSMTREPLLSAIEALRDQRDNLYTATVQPRREVERALRALQGDHDVPKAIDHLEDAARGLHQAAEYHRECSAELSLFEVIDHANRLRDALSAACSPVWGLTRVDVQGKAEKALAEGRAAITAWDDYRSPIEGQQ